MKVEEQHLAGIAFRGVETTAIRFRKGKVPSESASWPEILPKLAFDVRVEVSTEKDWCTVYVSCEFGGTEGWELATEVQGSFEIPSETDSTVGMDVFARRHALAILMPFLREAVASATSGTAMGPLLIPPINLVKLVQQAEAEEEAEEGAEADG